MVAHRAKDTPITKPRTIEEMQALAHQRGGECLSDVYINAHSKLRWRCKEGHGWEAQPGNIKQGRWCPECARKKRGDAKRKYTIKDIKALARQRGGECLSDTFTSVIEKLHWRCGKGHEWYTRTDTVQQGAWCPECAKKDIGNAVRQHTIEDMHVLARQRGGECLSGFFTSIKEKLLWRCKEGHQWEAVPDNIQQGQWCPECRKKKIGEARRKYTIEDMQRLAQQKGGKCLSTEFTSVSKNLLWECQKKHHWKAKPYNVQGGRWCPKCFWQELAGEMPDRAERKEHHTFEKAAAAAESKGGRCILPDDWETIIEISLRAELEWECAEGHRWKAMYYSIVKKQTWCPKCARERTAEKNRKYTIEDMQDLVRQRGGKCLSRRFLSVNSKMFWECAKGHRWEATPGNIKHGRWCPECGTKRAGDINRKYTIEDMQAVAQQREGECLSDEFINIAGKLHWRCKEGHEWEAKVGNILTGNWCPKCSLKRMAGKKRKYTIEDMQNLAQQQEGECLTEVFTSINEKMQWRCREGHEWEARPCDIQQGSWCPKCRRNKNIQTHRKYSITDMQELANTRGGKCLSTEFTSISKRLLWECKEGHQWEATPKNIKQGTWCPYCAGKRR